MFEYLFNDNIIVNAVYNVPIRLLGDSSTGNLTDLERDSDHGASNLEINSSAAYLEKHNIIHKKTLLEKK